MSLDRRSFLSAGALGVGGAAVGLTGLWQKRAEARPSDPDRGAPGAGDGWAAVRAQFELDPQIVHMAGLLVASHPEPVRDAIAEHRRRLNEDPAGYLPAQNLRQKAQVRRAAARYMGVRPEDIALTDSTTMGTGLAIAGLRIREGQEMLTARFDYYSTHRAIAFQADRSGATRRTVPLYRTIQTATADEVVDSLVGEIRPTTRLVTATWVHSATGLRVPVRRIADRITEINRGRSGADRVVFFVDGVHGLGVEDVDIADLGCDLFSAGTHKWMFGPRGTGILWGHPGVHGDVRPTIPTFTHEVGWGGRMSPGGFKPFEHEWAMAEAFDFHRELGRGRVSRRIHALTEMIKEGLVDMDHVTLQSPLDHELTAGIVCFDVRGLSAGGITRALRRRGVVASKAPYSPSHARLTPGIYNTEQDVEEALRAVRDLR